MDENTIMVDKIKAQLARFSGIISKGFPKSKRRLINTEDRLSRDLDDIDFTDGMNHQICRLGASKVLDEMVIAMDLGDIRKKFASKMAYLCGIRDGSEREVGNSWWLCKCVAADIEHTRLIPLTVRLTL